MTLRLTVMMAETSRTSRVGAPGEDTHKSDPHWPGPATLPQPRAPQNNHPTHTGSSAPQVLLLALPCWLTLGSLFLSLHLTFLICKMGVSGRSLPVPHCTSPAWDPHHPPNFTPSKGEAKCALGLARPHPLGFQMPLKEPPLLRGMLPPPPSPHTYPQPQLQPNLPKALVPIVPLRTSAPQATTDPLKCCPRLNSYMYSQRETLEPSDPFSSPLAQLFLGCKSTQLASAHPVLPCPSP